MNVKRSMRKTEEQRQIDEEERQLLNSYQEKLAKYYLDQKEIVEKETEYRNLMRKLYHKEADVRKRNYKLSRRNH